MGEGIHEGRIVKWHVKEGDTVKADDIIADMETDKAIVEMPSPASGKITRMNFKEGDTVKVGEVIVVIDGVAQTTKQTPQPANSQTLQPTIPQPAGASAKQPSLALPKQAATALLAGPASVPSSTLSSPASAAGGVGVLATPSTRKLAREMGVDITRISGTGTAGRITDEDVRRAAGQPTVQPAGQAQAAAKGVPTPAPFQITVSEGDIRIPLSGLRKIIADRMTYSKTHIPHACGMDYLDVTKLVMLREKEKRMFEPRGVKLTYLPFVVKACVIALKRYPSFNAHFDPDRGELVAKKEINIGIAVDTPDGLVVPVVKNADRKSIVEIAQDIEHLAAAAKERKLKLEEIRGSTFSITNVGSVGGMYSTPIINPPEIGIMGIHRIRDMPLIVDGIMQARKVMGISMCFDHRVVDGALATEFMNTVKQHLEDPDLMLVEMI